MTRAALLAACLVVFLSATRAITHEELWKFNSRFLEEAPNGFVPPLIDPHPHRREKRVVYQSCPAGYTGTYCENPICTNPQNVARHDGEAGDGEIVFNAVSPTCGGTPNFDNYSVAFDAYMEYTTINVRSLSPIFPSVRLYTPTGVHVVPDSYTATDDGTGEVSTYNNLIGTYGPGQYQLTVMAAGSLSCTVSVLSRSKMAVDGGFVQNATDDAVQVQPMVDKGVERNPIVNNISYFGFKPFGLDSPGQALFVTFYKGGVQLFPPINVRYRYGCTAYDYAGPTVCPDVTGIYHLWVSGIDYSGNLWNRMYIYLCDSAGGVPTTQPIGGSTPPPTQGPTECFNGGTITTTAGNTSRCYCGAFFEGYQCETKRCFNDGILGPNGVCACQPGYTNTFCQDVVCTRPSMGNFDTSRSSIAFVIRGTTTMAGYWNDAYRAAMLTIQDIQGRAPGFLQSYVLVVFANGVLLKLGEYTNSDDFLLNFNNASSLLVAANSCMDSVYAGVSIAMNTESFNLYKRSPIFIWTDALPNDGQDIQYNLYGQIAFYRGQIFSMLPVGGNDTCVIDTNDIAYRGFRQMAAYSQGLLSRANSSDLSAMHPGIAMAIRNAVHLATNDLLDQCSYAPQYQTFFVDETFATFHVYATGTQLTVVVNGPQRTIVTPTNTWTFGNTYIQRYDNAPKGNYLIAVSSTVTPAGPCAYRVIGNANTNAFLATADSLNTDMTTPYGFNPIYQVNNYIVAHINNFPVDVSQMTGLMAELTVWTNEAPNRTRTMVYASNGAYRDSCDYHFQFGEWKCPIRNMMFYAQLYVEDGTGYIMSRVVTGFCVTSQFCFGDNCNGCQNGGVPDPRNNATCLCPPGYNGTNCANIQCQNGGTPNVYDCLCPDGWTGLFCEISKCIITDYSTPFTPNGKSLALLVHDSLSTRGMLNKMNQNIAQTVQEIVAQHPVWINNYKLIAFNDVSITAEADTNQPNLFITAFNNVYNMNQQNPAFSCNNLRVAETIYSTLRSTTTTQFGIIYVYLMGLPNINETVLYELNEMLQISHVQVNFVQGSPMPCGASLSDPAMRILFNIAASTGGTVYLANSDFAGKTLLTIPTTYAKSYVYQNFVPDCSNRSYFYVPIDSETQTIQVQIYGDLDDNPPDNPAVVYTLPDASFPTVNTLYTDVGSNARFDEIFKPCDLGWRLYDQQCWWFDHNQRTWPDALSTCNSLNANLATLYDNKTEQDLFFNIGDNPTWIGLNDRATLGTWVWALLNGVTLTLQNTGYTNWGSGMPVNDSNRQCVTDQRSTGWIVQDCNSVQFYACVKHIYDYSTIFGGENANFMAPGMLTISVKTYTDPGGPPAPCEVKVSSQSGIRAFLGYGFNQHADLDSFMPIQDSSGNYFVSHVASLSNTNPGRLQYAHFYVTDNMQMIGVQQFKRRDTGTCMWEHVSTAFQCPTQNTSYTAFHPFLNANETGFQTALTGIDFNGYLFQRIRPTVCYIRNPLRNCDNGGVYSNAQQRCICPPDWFGDRCELPICYNGQMDQVFLDCICPAIVNPPQPDIPLYSGAHCEYPNCVRGSNSGLPLPVATNKTFVLILDGSNINQMADTIANLQQLLTNITQFIPGVYGSYIAVIVRDDSYQGQLPVSAPIIGTDFNAWLTNLISVANSNLYASTSNGRYIFTGMVRFLSDTASRALLQPQSHVFVLTGAIPLDGANLHAVEDYMAPYQLQFNFIYMDDTTNPGGPSVNPFNDTNVLSMYRLQYVTGGSFYQVHNWTNAETFWYVAMAQRYNSFFIQSSVNFNCTNFVEYFAVDSSSTKILLDIYTANPPSLVFTDNNGSAVANAPILARTNTNYLISADVGEPGTWTLSIDQGVANAGFCYAVVKGIDSTNLIAWAFTQDTSDNGAHTNDAILYPDGRNTSRNSILANIPFGYGTVAQIFDATEKTLLWSSPLIPRQQCTYNYVTRDSFPSCPAENFMVAINAYDDALHPVRRVRLIHCVNYHGLMKKRRHMGSTVVIN